MTFTHRVALAIISSLKGEQKSKKEEQVYYSAEGPLTKVPVGAAAQIQKAKDSSTS